MPAEVTCQAAGRTSHTQAAHSILLAMQGKYVVYCLEYREQVGVGGTGVGDRLPRTHPKEMPSPALLYECRVEGSAPLHPDLFLASSLPMTGTAAFSVPR